MKVTATARRSGGWWAIEVSQVPGAFAQSRRLDQAGEAAAAAVADLLGVDPTTVDVEVAPALPAETLAVVAAAEDAAARARIAQAEASSAMRQAVALLRQEAHLTTRDAATLLGVSHQRVAQLSGS